MEASNNLYSIEGLTKSFSVWGENTFPSKYDQLVWVEDHFALLGRDVIDLKLDKNYYTGIFYPIHLLSETALATTKKVSEAYYGKPETHIKVCKTIIDIVENGKTALNQIGNTISKDTTTKLSKLSIALYSFEKGLRAIGTHVYKKQQKINSELLMDQFRNHFGVNIDEEVLLDKEVLRATYECEFNNIKLAHKNIKDLLQLTLSKKKDATTIIDEEIVQ